MKVLVLLNYYYPYVSGLSEYARLLCEKLCRHGCNVTVLTAKYDNLPETEIINGVNVIRTPVWFKISKGTISPKFITQAVKYAKQADIVNLHLPMLEAGVIATFIPKNKIVCTYHCDINLPKGIFNNNIMKVMDFSHKLALKNSKYVIVNTIEYIKMSRMAYKYINKMKEIAPPIKELPQVKRKEHKGFRIGFCGRIVEEKGIDILIKAFELLQRERSNIELVIGGDYEAVAGGSIYLDLMKYIQDQNIRNVRFVGKIPEEKMAEFYASLDVFVLPSINSLESFGMVQIEAMLCGTPVIASDLLGVRTVVQNTGMGLICKSGDVEDLKRCIVQIMEDFDAYFRNRAQIEERYSSEQSVIRYLEIFNEMAQ